MSTRGAAEQLHYSWAKEGLEGLSRFQVCGASEGLRDVQSALARLAVRLCRYDRASGTAGSPRSYGWIDARDRRFVFSRVDAGLDGFGRPGNFAAHVLVLPLQALCPAEVLELADSWTWWRGGATTRDLPRVPLAELAKAAGASAAPEPPREVVARLFAAGWKGQVRANDRELLDACLLAAHHLPETLAAVTSFSTYEAGKAQEWFDLYGAPGAGPASPAQRDLRAADLLCAEGPAAARRRHSLVQAARGQQGVDWRDFAALAAGMAAVDGEEPDVSSVVAALSRRAVAEDVLLVPAARELIARLLVDGDESVVSGLGRSVGGLSDEMLLMLGALTGQATPAEQVAAVSTRLGRLSPVLLDGYARGLAPLAASHDAALHEWPSQLLLAGVKGTSWPASARDRSLALLVPAAEHVLRRRLLSPADRAVLCRRGLSAGSLPPRRVLDAVADDPDLRDALLPALSPEGLLDVFRAGSLDTVALLVPDMGPRLPPQALVHVLHDYGDRLPVEAVVNLVAELLAADADRDDPAWAELTEILLLRCVREEVARRQVVLPPQRAERLLRGVRPLRPWLDLAHHLTGLLQVTRSRPAALASLLRKLPPDHRPLAARLAVQHHARFLRQLTEVDQLLGAVADALSAETSLEELVRATTPPFGGRASGAALPVLQYVMTTHLWSPRVRQATSQLIAACSDTVLERLQVYCASQTKPVQRRCSELLPTRARPLIASLRPLRDRLGRE